MSLDRAEVRRIASLARLDLAAAEEQAVAEQLGKIVEYFDQLAQFETAEPQISADPAGNSAEAEDDLGTSLQPERWRANAPQTMDGYLVVPRIKSTP